MNLRKAEPADKNLVFKIIKAAFREYIDKVGTWDDEEQIKRNERRFKKQDFRIIQENGVDVGMLAMVQRKECLKVHQLHILPEHQSKGIGKACMEAIFKEADEKGIPVRLRVLKVNPRAHEFYLRLGFRDVGETETHNEMERISNAC
jgi:N-acetylglutamate synthase-like GNAT family acetyltransferase